MNNHRKHHIHHLRRRLRSMYQRQQRLRCQIDKFTALHETSLILMQRLDKEELLEAILERATVLTDTEHGYIYLLEPGQPEMQIQVGRGFFKNHLGLRVKRGQGMGGVVWENEKPLMVDDYQNWPHRLTDPAMNRLRSVVGIPLKDPCQIVGVIGLARMDEGRPFEPDDVTLLNRFADLALIALDKARLYGAVKRELDERERTEATLRESEERHRGLLESSPDPIVVYDMQGRAVYVNPAFEQTFGYSRKQLLGKQIDFVPSQCWPETRKAIDEMLAGKKIHLFETKRLTRDGRTLDIQLSSTLCKDSQGNLTGNIVILRDITGQKQAEEELKQYHDHLEDLVNSRTAELAEINHQLAQEIEERIRAEDSLRKREKELQAQSRHLEEVNTALKVLLKQRQDDKQELEEVVLCNVRELVLPYLERLKKGRLSPDQTALIRILESNLNNIISPFISRLSSRFHKFTPMEIKVAGLVKEGRTNKEIAELLLLSKNTVMFHRYNIRRKLGLKNKKINLRSHLLAYD